MSDDHESLLCRGLKHDFKSVESVVVSVGSDQWSLIGERLGYEVGQMNAMAFDKPIPAGKLQTIIRTKAAELGEDKTKRKLLEACHNQKILARVVTKLEQGMAAAGAATVGATTTIAATAGEILTTAVEATVDGTTAVAATASDLSTSTGDKIDVLIVTAAKTEFEAASAVLKKVSGQDLKDCPLHYSDQCVLGCMVATWKPSENRCPMMVGVVQQTEIGADGVAKIVDVLKDVLKSQKIVKHGLVAMIGMCAGNEGSVVKLGDVLVPWEIALAGEGGKLEEKDFQVEAKSAELPFHLKTAVQRAAQKAKAQYDKETNWLDYIPDEFKGTPSPRYLFDATLFELQHWKSNDGIVNVLDLYAHLKEKYKWPELIEKAALNEALKHLQSSEYVNDVDGKRVRFKISDKGKEHISDTAAFDEFPRADSVPEIHHDPVIMGRIVNTALTNEDDWKQLKVMAAKRKAIGYEMEGHTFLDRMATWCQPITSILIKSVADFGTKEYKMKVKYYQEYVTAVATAFLIHFLTVTEPSSWQTKA